MCSSRGYFPENGCETNVESTVCACDTDLCNGEVTATQSPRLECYWCTDCETQFPDYGCYGEVCIKTTNGAFMISDVKLSSITLARKYQYSQTRTAMQWCFDYLNIVYNQYFKYLFENRYLSGV